MDMIDLGPEIDMEFLMATVNQQDDHKDNEISVLKA